MDTTLPVIAGMVSTAVFAGNTVHCVYVFHLPPGPIWVLHTFYVITSALMLYRYLRSRQIPREASATENAAPATATATAGRR